MHDRESGEVRKPAGRADRLGIVDPLLALGLFVGIPVGLAVLISIAVFVPRAYSGSELEQGDSPAGDGLITSSRAVPNPAALPSTGSARPDATGGVHGTW